MVVPFCGWRQVTLLLIPAVVMAVAALAVLAADDYLDAGGAVRTGKLSFTHKEYNRNYYMYVPTNYTPQKKWPVVISAPGTFPFDSSPGTRDSWVDVAEKNGLIILCPDFDTANGLLNIKGDQDKLARDNKVVMAILDEVRKRYSVDANGIFTTGWSGGGYPAHYLGLKNPSIVRGIIGRCANFSEDLVDDETARKARHMHVFCFFTTGDLAGIPEQNRRANFWYTTRGFLNFEITEIPGGHMKNNQLAAEWILKVMKSWPIAHVQASATSGQAPLTVDFHAIASHPTGRITTYVWQFGDGGVSIHPAVSHTFAKPKVYNVFLTVIDAEGHQEYAQVDIDVK